MFRYMDGVVYIFENPEIQRIKIGMSINGFEGRLNDLNDIWTERRVMCQICGKRLLADEKGLIPVHPKNSPRKCPGGNELPLEKDTSLAQSYLEDLKKQHPDLKGSEKGSCTKMINTLEQRINNFSNNQSKIGIWKARVVYHTEQAEHIELSSHKILSKYLDKEATHGEIFSCSVEEACEVVESVLEENGILDTVQKETFNVENILK